VAIEVRSYEVTRDGILRHPTFLGLYIVPVNPTRLMM
jgi:hypothetical protein